MISSGIKRGLAASAITAMAVAGFPLLASPASANTFAEQFTASPNQVILYSLTSGKASTASDGTNTTVHLVANGGANVTTVQFEFSADGSTYTSIGAPVSKTNGVFSTEWAPPAVLNNLPLTVRATGLGAAGTSIGSDSAPVTVSNATAVDITNAAGSAVGVFRQPYDGDTGTAGNNNAGQHNYDLGIISGKTSDLAASPAVSAYNLTTGAPTGATAVNGTIPDAVATNATTRTFTTSVDFSDGSGGTGYNFTAGNTNDAVVGLTDGSDDAEVVSLYQQAIGNATATGPGANTVPAGGTFSATVKVVDKGAAGDGVNPQPVRGAQVVFDRDGDGNVSASENNEHYYTNVNGVATIPNIPTSATAGANTYNFWVNTTDNDAYESAVDFQRPVTVTTYAPTAGTLASKSADGNFDFDEYAAGDLFVTAKDTNGNVLGNQQVQYTLSLAPLTGTAPAPVTGVATTGADGKATIPFTNLGSGTYTLNAYINLDNNPGPGAGDVVADPSTFKAGQSAITIAAPTTTPTTGSTADYTATLALSDGTVLPGRSVVFTYAPPTGGNSAVAATQTSSATVRNSDTQATGTTGTDGKVVVSIADPATPPTGESGGKLSAASGANAIGNAGASTATPTTVNFTGASVVVAVTNNGDNVPGTVTNGTVTIGTVAGTPVHLTTDHGFFTDGAFDPAPVVGAKVGSYHSLGTSIDGVTGANGVFAFKTTVARDAGYDDDGAVTVKVVATSAAATGDTSYTSKTTSALNGTVSLVKSTTANNTPTDPTLVGNSVVYDVSARDQFGNPVIGATIDLAVSGLTGASVTPASVTTSAASPVKQVTLASTAAGTATLKATWAATPSTVFVADGPDADTLPDAGSTTTASTNVTTTQQFYTTSFAQYVFTLTHTPTGTVNTGTVVTSTVKVVDQFGNPIQGLNVTFFRSGPGTASDQVTGAATSPSGQSNYLFTSETAGDANITAVVSQPNSSNTKNVTDTVTFTKPTIDPVATTFSIAHSPTGDQVKGSTVTETVTVLDQNGAGYAGATVNFVRSGPNGQSDSQSATTNSAGQATYTFVGTDAGTANITAVVDYTTGTRTLTDSVVFTPGTEPITATDFTISHNPTGTVETGTAITETVKVLDQNGAGFAGASVEFTRSGPNGTTESKSATTNAAGEATYTFVGTAEGTANITAVVDYGTGTKTLTDSVAFQDPEPTVTPIIAKIEDLKRTGKNDVMRVSADQGSLAKGATVTLYANTTGTAKVIATAKLNSTGAFTFYIVDPNGAKVGTKYHAVISATSKTGMARTGTITIK